MAVIQIHGSASTNSHVHIGAINSNGDKVSVSAGLANETTLFLGIQDREAGTLVPITRGDVRVSIAGVWTEGSGSAATAIDYSPDQSVGAWIPLTSVSGSFTSVYPAVVGDTFRFRSRAEVPASATSVSVNVWMA
jgi:hypothetical protein